MSTALLPSPISSDLLPSDLAELPLRVRQEFSFWRSHLEPILSLDRGVQRAIDELAQRTHHSEGTVRKKFYAVKKAGWSALIDRRYVGPDVWNRKGPQNTNLSAADKELVKTYCERYQRSNASAIKALRRDWLKGLVTTATALDPKTGFPFGWSERNLANYVPTKYELKNARIGRSAAASERQLVYTTRANLWVGSHYLFDDMWHDHFVNHLDQRKSGRPLEFHALDLFSANKFAWGMRVRTERADGTMDGLKEADMRFLLAHVLGNFGYSAQGTTLVVEHGTAAIREDLERFLFEETGGLITVARSGMTGAAAAAHQYAGRSKGNFRFKAALESLGNLIHNEMAALPGQTGKDTDHRPEQLDGLLKSNDALLKAIAYLPPERIEMLRWPLLSIQQFQVIASEIYTRINDRTDHDLEGWDMQYVPDLRSGGMRRKSPAEVFRPGARQLTRLRPQAVASILLQDMGEERSVRRGMIETRDGEISGDALRYDARLLNDGERYQTILNPYAPDALWAFDAKGRFVAACPRITSVDRGDIAAVQEACGRAAKAEAEALQPFRARHLKEAREKASNARHNASVVSGAPVTGEERAKARLLRQIAGEADALLEDSADSEEYALAEASSDTSETFSAEDLL